jgi:hypothetical protein
MALAKTLDKLGAVNLMLSASGETKVSTLVDDGINDTDVAQQVLDEIIIEVLSDGWYFNTVKKTLSPDTTGRIAISDNYLRVEGGGNDYRRQLTVRDKYLYDLDNDTDQFTLPVELRVITNLDFTNIPSAMRFYIARAAARVYQAQTKADPDTDQILFQQEIRAMERARKDNTKAGNKSWIHDSRSTTRMISERYVRYSDDYSDSRPI